MNEAFNEAVRIKPDCAEAYYYRGWVSCYFQQYGSAAWCYKEAARIRPDFAEAHYNLGTVYYMLEDRRCALREYEILMDLDEDLARELYDGIQKWDRHE